MNLDRLHSALEELDSVRAGVDSMLASRPQGGVFEGTDPEGVITAEVDAAGDLLRLVPASDWIKRVPDGQLASAVTAAHDAARAAVMRQWAQNDTEQRRATPSFDGTPDRLADDEVTEAQRLIRQFERGEASLTDLNEQVLNQQRENDIARAALDRPDAETSFESPSGWFSARSSGRRLTALDYHRSQIMLVGPDEIGAELVAVMHRIKSEHDRRRRSIAGDTR
ncbi:hypothetical protein CW368_12245 [Actinomycetales bacterium SN12]|nr:hypothetical protein CW368_12245 [Actinomycetales bacterium SN12]